MFVSLRSTALNLVLDVSMKTQCMASRPPRHVITPEVEAAEAQLQLLQHMLMNQQAELGAKRADVQVRCPAQAHPTAVVQA